MTTLGSGTCAACHHGRSDHGEDGKGPCEVGRCICNGFFRAGAGAATDNNEESNRGGFSAWRYRSPS